MHLARAAGPPTAAGRGPRGREARRGAAAAGPGALGAPLTPSMSGLMECEDACPLCMEDLDDDEFGDAQILPCTHRSCI